MIKKMLMIIAVFLFIPRVNATCDENRLKELKELAKNIEITTGIAAEDEEYIPHRDYTVNDYGEPVPQGSTQIIISGMSKEFNVVDNTYERTFMYEDFKNNALILNNELHGYRTFKVYSLECNQEIRSIYIKVPRYNEYSTDPLCEGISGTDLAICGTWYDKEVDYETFKSMIEDYKENKIYEENEDEKNNNIINEIIDFIKSNYLYIIGGVALIITVSIIVIIRRKRSVLE